MHAQTRILAEPRHPAAPRRAGPGGLIRWLVAADARFREARRIDRLTAAERRDIGLSPVQDRASRQTADRRFLSGQW